MSYKKQPPKTNLPKELLGYPLVDIKFAKVGKKLDYNLPYPFLTVSICYIEDSADYVLLGISGKGQQRGISSFADSYASFTKEIKDYIKNNYDTDSAKSLSPKRFISTKIEPYGFTIGWNCPDIIAHGLNLLVRSENMKYTSAEENYDGMIFRVVFDGDNSSIFQVKGDEFISLDITDDQFDCLTKIWKEKDPKLGIIDIDQNVIVKPEYDYFRTDGECIIARKDNLYGVIDRNGNNLSEICYTNIRNQSDGLRAVLVGDKWGYIDNCGNMVISPAFKECFDFHNGRAWAAKSSKFGVIDKSGNFVVEPAYVPKKRNSTNDSGVLIFVENRKQGAVNNHGKIICEPKYEEVHFLCGGLSMIMRDGSRYTSDFDGNIKAVPYESKYLLGNGLFKVEIKGLWSVVDSEDKVILPPEYKEIDAIGPLYKDKRYLTAKKDNKVCVMDFDGNVIVKPQVASYIGYASEKYLILWKGERKPKASLIDYDGNVITKEIYDGIKLVGENLIIARIGDQYGICDFLGNFVAQPKYYYMGDPYNGMVSASLENDLYTDKRVVIDVATGDLLPYYDMCNPSLSQCYSEDDPDSYARVSVKRDGEELYGIIYKDRTVVVEPIYQFLEFMGTGLIEAKFPLSSCD